MTDLFGRSLELGDLVLINSSSNYVYLGVIIEPTPSKIRVFRLRTENFGTNKTSDDQILISRVKSELKDYKDVMAGVKKANYWDPTIITHFNTYICKLNIKYPDINEFKNALGYSK